MSFADRLKFYRKEKGITQEELAEMIGLSRQSVAKWESGQSYPDINNLVHLSNIFGISIDELIQGNNDCCIDNYKKQQHIMIYEDIINFLIRAQKATYAGAGVEVEPSRPSSHDLNYVEGELRYIDSYLGGERFAGEEAIWKSDIPYWAMNYCGRIIDKWFSVDFLKDALLQVPNEYPYRGPLVYHNGDYKYHCIINGNFEWFSGYEEIFYKNNKVYECMFHGGLIK